MKNTTKLLSIILVLGMILGVFTMLGSFSAGAASAAYNGTPVTPTQISESTYASLGLAGDKWQQYNGYYAIRNAEELYGFAELVNGGNGNANAVLLDDIVVNSGTVSDSGSSSGTTHYWYGIGGTDTENYFRGTFDGNGHSVSGLYYKEPEGQSVSYVGFFRVLSGATVKNLTIKNTYFYAESDIGTIAGHAIGSTSNIINCRVESDVTVVKGAEGQDPYVGGILGGANTSGFNFYVRCKITNCVFLGTVVCKLYDFVSAPSSRDYMGAISGVSMREGNGYKFVVAENCFYRSGALLDKNGNNKYKYGDKLQYTDVFDMALGGVIDYRGDAGCSVISSASDAHSPVVAEHKGIKTGDKDYKYCVRCGKRMATITLTAPTSYAIPGASMQITAKADYSEVTSFVIANGTNYTVNGMTIKVSTDALVGSDITVKVTSAETANVHAAEATLKLKVGVVDSTAEIAGLRDELNEAIAALRASLMAEDDDITAEIEALWTAITNAQNAITALQTDSATKAELTDAITKATDTITEAYTKAIEDAKTYLEGLIDAAEQAAIDGDTALETKLTKAIEEAKTYLEGLIDAAEQAAINGDEALDEKLTKAIEDAKAASEAADKQLQANIDAAIKKAADELEAARKDLQEKIDNNAKTIATEVARLDKLIKDTEAFLLSEDARNRAELEAALAEAKETLKAAIDKVAEDLETTRKDLQTKIDTNTETIATEVLRLDMLVADTKAVLEAADAKNRAELEEALATAERTLKKSIDRVSSKLTNTQNVLLNVIRAGDIQLGDRITEVNTALLEALALLDTKTVEADAALKAELTATIEAADKALDEAIKAVQKNLDDAKAELSKAIADGDTALTEKLEALEAALKAAEAALKSADESNKAELLAAIEAAKADLTKLINDGDKQNADALEAAMVVLRAEVEQAKKDAQLVPTILVIIALAGDIVLAACLIITKKKKI